MYKIILVTLDLHPYQSMMVLHHQTTLQLCCCCLWSHSRPIHRWVWTNIILSHAKNISISLITLSFSHQSGDINCTWNRCDSLPKLFFEWGHPHINSTGWVFCFLLTADQSTQTTGWEPRLHQHHRGVIRRSVLPGLNWKYAACLALWILIHLHP